MSLKMHVSDDSLQMRLAREAPTRMNIDPALYATGEPGVGIAEIELNEDYTLTITLTNGETYTTASIRGLQGEPGQDGYTPIKGVDYFDGQDGEDGQDGHSPVVTASKTGTVTTIYVDGSSIATINDGADGQDGQDGQDGHTPVVTASKTGTVTTVSVDGSPIATINDGADGQDGEDGTTPVRGTDYWTAADQASIVADVIAALPLYDGSVV